MGFHEIWGTEPQSRLNFVMLRLGLAHFLRDSNDTVAEVCALPNAL